MCKNEKKYFKFESNVVNKLFIRLDLDRMYFPFKFPSNWPDWLQLIWHYMSSALLLSERKPLSNLDTERQHECVRIVSVWGDYGNTFYLLHVSLSWTLAHFSKSTYMTVLTMYRQYRWCVPQRSWSPTLSTNFSDWLIKCKCMCPIESQQR